MSDEISVPQICPVCGEPGLFGGEEGLGLGGSHLELTGDAGGKITRARFVWRHPGESHSKDMPELIPQLEAGRPIYRSDEWLRGTPHVWSKTSHARLFEDADLVELEYRFAQEAEKVGAQERPFVSAALALKLVAEVRRLRSDEWLERAAEDITSASSPHNVEGLLHILRKHRDGKA